MLQEGAHISHSIWTNCVVPINQNQYMLFDKERNVFVFEREALPTNDHEKFQMNLIACIRLGEEVTSAIQGSMSI
jgi:hypothetical protein